MLDAFDTAVDSAVATSTHMISTVGTKGVTIILATLAVAVVVIFIGIGFRKGMKAMRGKH